MAQTARQRLDSICQRGEREREREREVSDPSEPLWLVSYVEAYATAHCVHSCLLLSHRGLLWTVGCSDGGCSCSCNFQSRKWRSPIANRRPHFSTACNLPPHAAPCSGHAVYPCTPLVIASWNSIAFATSPPLAACADRPIFVAARCFSASLFALQLYHFSSHTLRY